MKQLPLGARYILWMDMAAQYSFFGMNAILPLFLLNNIKLTEIQIVSLMQAFLSWRYIAMIAATILSETLLTQKSLMIFASVISLFGHIALSYNLNIANVYLGLILIAIGIGIIKICIQPLIAYQCDSEAKRKDALSWLYVFTNMGTASIIITPYILQIYGYKLAFISPTALVIVSAMILLIGNRFIKTPPLNKTKDIVSLLQFKELLPWLPLITIICIFEVFFVQMYSSWAIQGEKMNCLLFNRQVSAVQLQILDTIFIITLVPLISFKILPFVQQKWNYLLSTASQLSFGFICGGASFAIIALLQILLQKDIVPSLLWQTPAFFLLAIGEIIVICIGKNLLYVTGQEHLRPKLSLLYAIISLLTNSLAEKVLNIFNGVDITFFGSCTIALLAIGLLLKIAPINSLSK